MHNKAKSPTPPIFIGGAGRSGTSLLRTLLNTHPNIAIGTEFKATPFIARMRHEFSKFEPHLQEHFALEASDIDNAFSQLISVLLDKYKGQRGKSRIGDKTPKNVFFFPHIHRMFPESPLIHVIRDGRDVVCSLLQRKLDVARLHRYEAFTNIPIHVDWSFTDLLVVMPHMLEILESRLPSISEQVDVEPFCYGVDVEHYTFKKRSPGHNLAYVGYLHHRKNPALLLQCLKALVNKDPRYRLHVAGIYQQPLYKLYVDHLVEQLDLSENIVFDGWVTDIHSWLEDKNFLVSTSIHESFGYGITEAMARGIKPLIHHFPHATDIYPDDWLFSSVDEFVDAVLNGSYDSEVYRSHVVNNFSLSDQVHKIDRSLKKITARSDEVVQSPVIILGNQKSGTTAIAGLLAKLTDLSVSLDIRDTKSLKDDLPKLHSGQITIDQFISEHTSFFSSSIQKEPNLTFVFEKLDQFFSDPRYVLIARDPRDNIRSIFNRLGINKNHPVSDLANLNIPDIWKFIIETPFINHVGDSILDRLCYRWNRSVDTYLNNEDKVLLILYEDFCSSKEEEITSLAQSLGLEPAHSIAKFVDRQYQPEGKDRDTDWVEFFGHKNLRHIEELCGERMSQLGYELSIL